MGKDTHCMPSSIRVVVLSGVDSGSLGGLNYVVMRRMSPSDIRDKTLLNSCLGRTSRIPPLAAWHTSRELCIFSVILGR